MKVFRFGLDPSLRQFWVDQGDAWWPQGVSMLPQVERLFQHENRHPGSYAGYPPFLAIGDLLHHTLHHLVWSEKAQATLGGLSGLHATTTALFDGQRCHVVQPELCPKAIDLSASQLFLDHQDRPLAITEHVFREQHIQHDLFYAGLMPFPEIYLSERFAQLFEQAGLSGFGGTRLVWDGGPVGPQYAPTCEPDRFWADQPRLRPEYALLLLRAQWATSDWERSTQAARQAMIELQQQGWLPGA